MFDTTKAPPRPVVSHADRVQRPVKGLIMAAVAAFLFAIMDVLTKELTQTIAVPTVMAGRFGFGVLFILLLIYPRQGVLLFRVRRKRQVLIRSVVLPMGSVLAAIGFKYLPLAETTAIIYLSPLGVLVLSALILGEKVRPASWVAAGAGFLGLLLITRPGGGLVPLGVVCALGAAMTQTWYHLSSRLLADTESTVAMMFYATLSGAIIFGATLPFDLGGAALGAMDWLILMTIGALGILSHFLLTAAYREAAASRVAPMLYIHILWAALIGLGVYGHIPDLIATLGIVIVAVAGALALWSRPAGRKAA